MYEKVLSIVNSKTQWSSGEVVTVKEGKTRGHSSRLVARNAGGIVNLFLFVKFDRLDHNFYSEMLPIAILREKWTPTITKDKFESWQKATSKKLDNHIKKYHL